MLKRDYIMDQIEQMGKAISALLSGFLGMKSEGKAAIGLDITNRKLKDDLDIDVNLILKLPENDLRNYLEERKLVQYHLDKIAFYFLEIGESKLDENDTSAKNYLIKAKQLMDLAAEFTKTTSLEQLNLLKKIGDLLNEKFSE